MPAMLIPAKDCFHPLEARRSQSTGRTHAVILCLMCGTMAFINPARKEECPPSPEGIKGGQTNDADGPGAPDFPQAKQEAPDGR